MCDDGVAAALFMIDLILVVWALISLTPTPST